MPIPDLTIRLSGRTMCLFCENKVFRRSRPRTEKLHLKMPFSFQLEVHRSEYSEMQFEKYIAVFNRFFLVSKSTTIFVVLENALYAGFAQFCHYSTNISSRYLFVGSAHISRVIKT